MNESTKRRIKELGLNEADFEPQKKTDAEKIAELEAQNEMLTQCLMELADIIYA